MSLNLILGHSARAAIGTMQRCRSAHTVCVVSPSPRAERRMSDEDLVETFDQMAEIMTRMLRMETHFYSSNALWLPAAALTAFLKKAKKLQCILLNGLRLKGSEQDMIELRDAILNHPSLVRTCLFNIDCLRGVREGANAPMQYLLEGMTQNPKLIDFTLRFAKWANPHMGILCDPKVSQITSLRLSGKETMYGPAGDGISQGFPDMIEALKTNTMLEELIINQCPGPIGTGALFAEMLRENTHLQKLYCHLTLFNEAVPIVQAMAHENSTLTHMELYINDPTDRKRGEPSAGDDPEQVKIATDAAESALMTNGTLLHLKVSSRSGIHTTEKMKLFTRMNAAGRMELLQNDDLTGEEGLEFLEKYSNDTSLVWYILRMKASMLPLVIETASAAPPIEEVKEDSDDEEPVKFGNTTAVDTDDEEDEPTKATARIGPMKTRSSARRSRAAAVARKTTSTPSPRRNLRKRKQSMVASNLQAARSKTLKRRKRK